MHTTDSLEWLSYEADYILRGKILDVTSVPGKRKKDVLDLYIFQAEEVIKGLSRPLYYFSVQSTAHFKKRNEYLVFLRETAEGFNHYTNNDSQYFNLWPLYDYRAVPVVINLDVHVTQFMTALGGQEQLFGTALVKYCKEIVEKIETIKKANKTIEAEFLEIAENTPMADSLFEGAAGRLRVPGFLNK